MRCGFCAALVLLGSFLTSQAPAQNWALPPSATGQALGQLLDVIASGERARIESFVLTDLDEQFQSAFSMEDHVKFFQRLHEDIHPFELASVRQTGDYSAEAIIAGRKNPLRMKIRFGLAERPPHPFNDLSIQPVVGPQAEFQTIPELQTFLTERERLGLFSGVVLIARNGDVEFLEPYGYASKRYGVPNRADTKFNVGSINKMFTGIAILQLVQKGAVALDSPISDYLDGIPSTVGDRITVRHLLQHRSGWGTYFDKEYYLNHWPKLRTVDDYMTFIRDIPLDFEPGSSRQYSNVGYVVLGAVIEAVTGTDYYDYVRDNVFTPAGMKDTDSYEVDAYVPNLATGYVAIETEAGVQFERENIFLHSARGTPAGGGYSTAEDLLRFDRALRSNSLLSPAFTRFFFTGFEGEPVAGPLDGGVGYAGGGPGINAVLEMDFRDDITVIVLSNYDPPTAEELGPPIMQTIRGMK